MEADTRVIEFLSLGTSVRNTQRFFVHNPTDRTWSFKLVRVEDPISGFTAENEEKSVSSFACQTSTGIVEPGKKFELIFHYTPLAIPPMVGASLDADSIVEQSSFAGNNLEESLWRFQVGDYASKFLDGTITDSSEKPIAVPLLLVGRVSEPRVFLDKSSIKFRSMLIGGNVLEAVNLVNSEHIPFSFTVEAPSELLEVAASRQKSSLLPVIDSASASEPTMAKSTSIPPMTIEPMQGVVSPNSSFPISIHFHPQQKRI